MQPVAEPQSRRHRGKQQRGGDEQFGIERPCRREDDDARDRGSEVEPGPLQYWPDAVYSPFTIHHSRTSAS